jgi:hypothetical protein
MAFDGEPVRWHTPHRERKEGPQAAGKGGRLFRDGYFAGHVIEADRSCWAQPALGRLVAKRARSCALDHVARSIMLLIRDLTATV